MATVATTVTQLIRAYNISGIQPIIAKRDDFSGKIPDAVQKDKVLYISKLGTPVFTDLTFERISYTDQNGQKFIVPSITLETVLITVSQPKIIVKTEIQGHDGTVKEYIANGDYEISINGILNGGNGRYPIELVHDLNQMLYAPIAIPVTSWYLQNLDIYSIVVTNKAFDQEAGGYAKQNFTITAISDIPTELLIINV